MTSYKLISADSHIVEPPDLYTNRIEPKFRDRAPRLERLETPPGRKFDAWFIDGQQAGTLGAVMQAGQRFEDPSQIDFLGDWEDVRLGAYDPQAMIKENEMDGVWGACLQPSQGLFWYRIPDSEMLTAICRVYNDWIADFCKPFPDRLKGIAMLNVDDVEEASHELERCARLGLVGAFIPVVAAGRPALSAPDLRAALVDGPGRRAPAAPAHRHAARRYPGLRVHNEPRRAHRRRPLDHGLLGALLAVGDDLRGRLRSLSRSLRSARSSTRRRGSLTGSSRWTSRIGSGRCSRRAGGRGKGSCRATTGAATCSWSSWRTTSASRCATRSASTTCSGAATSRTPSRRGRSRAISSTGSSPALPRPDLRRSPRRTPRRLFGFKLN